MLTRQEIFNNAWRGLESQGFEQSLSGGGCAYRGDAERRCAIGWCIPDDLYRDGFEGRVVSETPMIRKAAGVSARDKRFALSLQECHDDNPSPDAMRVALVKFAISYGLTIPASEQSS